MKQIAILTAAFGTVLTASPALAQQRTTAQYPLTSDGSLSNLGKFNLSDTPRVNPLRIVTPLTAESTQRTDLPNYRLDDGERCTRAPGAANVRIQFSMTFSGGASPSEGPSGQALMQFCAGRRALRPQD